MAWDSVWKDEAAAEYALNAANLSFALPDLMCIGRRYTGIPGGQRRTIAIDADLFIKLVVNGVHYGYKNTTYVTISPESVLDTGTSFIPGRSYRLFLVRKADGTAELVCSLNATYPAGATPDTSRAIAGFDTVCADVGTIAGHPYSGYQAGDIHIHSLWDLRHRPACSPEGMAYIDALDEWWDIYLQSGTGTNTRSVYGGTVTNLRNFMDHMDDLAAVGKRLIDDYGFQIAAAGSNEQTSLGGWGGAEPNPKLTGGHSDNAGRRMVSAYGLEECCGYMWQWGDGGGRRFVRTTFDSADVPASTGPNDAGSTADSDRHDDWPGEKGSIWHTDGRPGLLLGGRWNAGSGCGSRAVSAEAFRSAVSGSHAGRGRARSRV
jgi:hypothetical protein